MTSKNLCKIYSSYKSEYLNKIEELKSKIKTLKVFSFIFGPSWFIAIFFSVFLSIFLVIITAIIIATCNKLEKDLKNILKTNDEAEFYSNKLNIILDKSKEIINDILPYYEQSAKNYIDKAKTELRDGAISPFWDQIEEATKCLAFYNESVCQLNINGEIYSRVLDGKEHNFPSAFPFGTNISIPHAVVDEFNSTIRKAHTTDGFSNIWEHRKTQKILIVGFESVVHAINNMSITISSSINELKHSIKSDFIEVRYFQQEQLKSFESSQRIMNNTLQEMNTRLYYLQYNKKSYNY
jgi:hypothetical protein